MNCCFEALKLFIEQYHPHALVALALLYVAFMGGLMVFARATLTK